MRETFRMYNPDTGKTGDIHPDEVDNMRRYGWRFLEEPAGPAEDPTIPEMREAIEKATGMKPHHRLGWQKLRRMYDEVCQ